MKSRKHLMFLIPITLGIWAYIGYKIYKAKYGEEDFVVATTNYQKNELAFANDTFSINLNYRDPFLGENVKIIKDHAQINYSEVKSSNPSVTNVLKSLPNVQYFGLIKNSKQNKQVALIQINGTMNNLSVGDKQDGVEILKIQKDSIEVRFQKEKYFVRK